MRSSIARRAPLSARTAALLGVLALGSLSSCSESQTAPNEFAAWSAYPELEATPWMDLAAELHTADVWFETTKISPTLIADRRYLTAGWSFPDHGDDASAEELFPVWTSDKRSEIQFYLAETGPRRLSFYLGAFRSATRANPLVTRILLNGQLLETVDVLPAGRSIDLELPVENQRAGLNRLELQFDKIWRISEVIEGSGDVRLVSAHCKEFLFGIQAEEPRRRQEEVRWMLPNGARIASDGPAGGRTLLQASASLVSHYLRVPKGASLRTGVALFRAGDAAPNEAQLRVTLTDRAGKATVLFDRSAKLGAAIQDVEASLAPWEGQIVQLDFDVRAAANSPEPVVGMWAAPAVLAPPAPAAPAVKGLDAAKTSLRGAPVVMLLLDAFNPFFAPTYGGRPGIAPNLERIRNEGTQFDTTYCQATYTISSVPSILTSKYTWEHGAWKESTKLLDSVPTWPEAFSAAGYRTVGLTCSTNGSSLFGFERGFETFVDLYTEVLEGRDTISAEQVLAPLDEILAVEDERPLFLWLHIVEPHEPYMPPSPWAGKYTEGITSSIQGDAETLWNIRLRKLVPTPSDLAKLKADYEANISYVDSVVGQIRTRLEEAGIWDAAIKTIFSDHGEAFMDHDSLIYAAFGHGSTAYDDQARIPLWMTLPKGIAPMGTNVNGLASNMDILPTIAELTGVTDLPAPLRGTSLVPALFDPSATPRETIEAHTANRMNTKRFLPTLSIRDASWKYIFTSGNAEELYDLRSDPGEHTNVAAKNQLLAGYYRQLLRRQTGFELSTGGLSVQGGEVELDAETIRRMQALGYIR